MLITQKVAQLASGQAQTLTIADAVIGVGYTGVKLSDNTCGVCFTFRNALGPKCGVIDRPGALAGLPAQTLIDLAMSCNLAEASLGVATINAILNKNQHAQMDAVAAIDVRPGDTLGMVGYFHPLVKQFKGKVDKLHIFERNITDDGLLPDWAEDIYLPQCDVVVITGVTFINKTIDHILALSKNAKEVVVMGASSCFAPDILRDYGVTLLAGGKVTDADTLLKIIAQGGGGLDVQQHVDKLCLRLADRRK